MERLNKLLCIRGMILKKSRRSSGPLKHELEPYSPGENNNARKYIAIFVLKSDDQ